MQSIQSKQSTGSTIDTSNIANNKSTDIDNISSDTPKQTATSYKSSTKTQDVSNFESPIPKESSIPKKSSIKDFVK